MAKPGKSSINVTELRQNLPTYLSQVRNGREIEVTSRGKVIARIVAGGDASGEARARIVALRKHSFVGDVISPTGARWEAEQ